MSFHFSTASCVAVGTFNIYIIQPKWLTEMEVWPKNEDYELNMDLSQPGFKFHRTQNDPLRWSVRPDRLTVETSDFGADCGKPIADVLHHLQWTRIQAIGVNETYACASGEAGDLIERILPVGNRLPEGYTDHQRTWHRAFKKNDTVTNIQLSVNNVDDKATVTINIHTDVAHLTSQNEVTGQAQHICREFSRRLAETRKLTSELLSVDLEHEPVNA